jgi:hypothetical protein
MSNEVDEVVTIAVMSNGDESIRTITNEYECTDTCWPHLVQVFLEQLQGLGYVFKATPEEMAGVLEDFHQDLVCSECNGCDEEKTPVVEKKKYPYTGVFKNSSETSVVMFTSKNSGKCIYTEGHDNYIGEYSTQWDEDSFTKVSK